MTLTRRQFLVACSGAVSAVELGSSAKELDRLPIGFSTLGCPRWDWATILNRAHQWGYAAVEIRGLQGEMDLTKCAEFKGAALVENLKRLADLNLRISDLGSSARMHEQAATTRAAQLDEGKRFIDLAQRLHAPYIRVFGDRFVAGEPKQATIERVAAGLQELAEHARGSQVGVLLESHGDFCDSPTLLAILKATNRPEVGLVWDAHHTVVEGKEAPADTLRQLHHYVHHVHLKDSKPDGKSVRYVLTGSGTIPLREIVQLLRKQQYQGFYSFEWEKVWHPDIEEPEVAFPQFAKVMADYFKAGA
jgi:sugar phosphate isomerase/epimerase